MINKHRFILVLTLLLFLTGCAPQPTMTENLPTKVDYKETTQPTEVPTLLETPYPIRTEASTATLVIPTTETQGEGRKFTFYLDQDRMDQFCLRFPQLQIFTPLNFDDYYISYVLEQDSLSSISIEDGTIIPLYVSEFPNGHLDGLVEFEYPWYTYSVTDSPQGFGDWNLHLVNVEDGTNTIIAQREQFGSYSLHNDISFDQGNLYLVSSTFDGSKVLSSQVYSIDLGNKETTLIIENPDADTYMSIISASNGYLVLEHDEPKSDVGFYLSLYDVYKKSFIDLPQTFPASMPDIEYPYVVWKNNKRFDQPESFTVYNIETGITSVHEITNSYSVNISISNRFVITDALSGRDQTGNSVILYSIDNDDIYEIQMGTNDIRLNDAYVDNENVIWTFTSFTTVDNYSSYICELPLKDLSSYSLEGISVDYATDDLISKYDTVEEFEDEGDQKIVFTTNIAVKNFKFVELSYIEEDPNIKFVENKVLYSMDELLPEKPFVVTWTEQGAIPHRGISFEDGDGTTRHFYLTMSGEDGSISLVEFQ